MTRKKRDPAQLRTLGLFSGMTPLEEAERELHEEAGDVRSDEPRDLSADAESTAIRWLGSDVFHEGDDIKVAVHRMGHAVVVLVYADVNGGARSTVQLKLSKAQWTKLKRLALEGR